MSVLAREEVITATKLLPYVLGRRTDIHPNPTRSFSDTKISEVKILSTLPCLVSGYALVFHQCLMNLGFINRPYYSTFFSIPVTEEVCAYFGPGGSDPWADVTIAPEVCILSADLWNVSVITEHSGLSELDGTKIVPRLNHTVRSEG